MMDYGSIENEDPLRKRRPTKTKTPYENEDLLRKRRTPTKTKTSYENEDLLRKRRPLYFCRKRFQYNSSRPELMNHSGSSRNRPPGIDQA